MTALPPAAYAAALAGFERMSSKRLDLLLRDTSPEAAFAMACGDLAPTASVARLLDTAGLAAAWRNSAAQRSPARCWEQCLEIDCHVVMRDHPDYPPVLLYDVAPAPVLFVRGDLRRITGRRVGIIGTRNATASGRETATVLGRDLATQGVHVVSGLARGIDGCAHRGVVSVHGGAAPIAVVGSGPDIVYPAEHRQLWHDVIARGVLLTEAPPGTAPDAYRFPMRNRIIAALSEVLVVVESRERGGSLLTVDEARARQVMVMAVPGAVNNRAAAGTNDLLRDGCPIVTDTRDVLIALNLDTSRVGMAAYDPRPRPSGLSATLLAACAEPRTLDQLTLLSGRSLVECAMAVGSLEFAGWVRQVNGWFERSPADAQSDAPW